MNETNNSNLQEIISDKDLELLRSYIESIKFGSVTLHIHDGKVVQIEKNEKIKIK
ncbi:MAG: YezD family protein [Syntrophomonadaceae bacterium]|nr:YezD family protein [Syntrophomonadaceae bacterium]